MHKAGVKMDARAKSVAGEEWIAKIPKHRSRNLLFGGYVELKSGFLDCAPKKTRRFVIPAKAGIQNMRQYFLYILASKRNGTLYVGVTSDLERRVYEHRHTLVEGFTKKYGVTMLVYYEQTSDVNAAIVREKRVKKWNRAWKLKLIESVNPEWKDLADEWFSDSAGSDTSDGSGFPPSRE